MEAADALRDLALVVDQEIRVDLWFSALREFGVACSSPGWGTSG